MTMMTMDGLWDAGMMKTEFRSCGEKRKGGGGRREGRNGDGKEVGRCVTILFVTRGTAKMKDNEVDV